MAQVKLTLILSGRTLARHEFDAFDVLKVGRNSDCDVMIDNLGVSRYHCEIARQDGICRLRDLNSGNGTFVNGSRVTGLHNLNDGDTITIGKYSIRFESESAAAPPGSQPIGLDTPIGQMGMGTLQIDASKIAAKAREALTKNRGFLSFAEGREVVLDKSLFTFGKASDADVQFGGWFCPRLVALVIRDESGFRLVDVSPNGASVRVNGLRRRDTWLNDNDKVEIRGKVMIFHRGMPLGK